jgi:hypothetical protein
MVHDFGMQICYDEAKAGLNRDLDSVNLLNDPRIRGAINIVHENTHPDIYKTSKEGKINLFYSPVPVWPKLVNPNTNFSIVYTDENKATTSYNDGFQSKHALKDIYLNKFSDFLRKIILVPREYYFVEPMKADELKALIDKGTGPREIVEYLGKENRVTSKKQIIKKMRDNQKYLESSVTSF